VAAAGKEDEVDEKEERFVASFKKFIALIDSKRVKGGQSMMDGIEVVRVKRASAEEAKEAHKGRWAGRSGSGSAGAGVSAGAGGTDDNNEAEEDENCGSTKGTPHADVGMKYLKVGYYTFDMNQ
jgi:hypothetical protein